MYSFINIKYLIFVIVFCLLSLISINFFIPSLMVIILLTSTFIGYKLVNTKLTTYKKDSKKLSKYFLVSLITNTLFSFVQGVIIILFIVLSTVLLYTTVDVDLLENFLITNVLSTSLFFLGIIFFTLFLYFELLKNYGLLKYFQTNNFNNIFKIKKHTKLIFKSNFFVNFLYYIGYSFVYIFIFLLIGFILFLIFPAYETNIGLSLLLFLIYFLYSGLLNICYQTMTKK